MGGHKPGLTLTIISDVIGTRERFCHIVRNFIDYFLDLTMPCTFERAVALK